MHGNTNIKKKKKFRLLVRYHVIYLTTGPQPLQKQIHHRVRSSASLTKNFCVLHTTVEHNHSIPPSSTVGI